MLGLHGPSLVNTFSFFKIRICSYFYYSICQPIQSLDGYLGVGASNLHWLCGSVYRVQWPAPEDTEACWWLQVLHWHGIHNWSRFLYFWGLRESGKISLWLTKVPVLEIPSYAWPSMTNRWPQIHCLTHQQHGELLHLLGYAIGFWPEETRSDRNHYVQINNDNVLATVVDNFPLNSDNNYSVPFDYCSIMFHHERVQAIYISVCSRYVWCHIDFQYVFVVRIYSKIPPFLRLSRIMAE